MGILEWVRDLVVVPHHYDPPEDQLRDIADIPIDYFVEKIVEHLPEDWGFGVLAVPDGNRIMYRAEASLLFTKNPDDPVPEIKSLHRDTMKRALEDLYYRLRDL